MKTGNEKKVTIYKDFGYLVAQHYSVTMQNETH